MLESVCEEMQKREDELNRLDAAAGDGDCGGTFASAAKGDCSSSNLKETKIP